MDPINMYRQVQDHQRNLRIEAEQDRWLRKARADQPGVVAQFLRKSGALILSIGGLFRPGHVSLGPKFLERAGESPGIARQTPAS